MNSLNLTLSLSSKQHIQPKIPIQFSLNAEETLTKKTFNELIEHAFKAEGFYLLGLALHQDLSVEIFDGKSLHHMTSNNRKPNDIIIYFITYKVKAISKAIFQQLPNDCFFSEPSNLKYINNLAKYYLKQQDFEKAILFYISAVKNNCAPELEFTLEEKLQLKKAVIKLYEEPANDNKALAQLNLGYCYEYGIGVKKNIAQAAIWYCKAAETESEEAQYKLGLCYEQGSIVEKNLRQAFFWFHKAAEEGYLEAQNKLGCYYYNGFGVDIDFTQAIIWYRKAADQEHKEAQYNLGNCYLRYGMEQDFVLAAFWFSKAAEQGHKEAQYNLGNHYFWSDVEQDYILTAFWYTKAAEQGHKRARDNLLMNFRTSIIEISKVYRKAKEEKDPISQFNIGVHYHKRDPWKNRTPAVKWYKKAVKQNYLKAFNNLAVCYIKGIGVEKDLISAEKLLRQASEQGDLQANHNLNIFLKEFQSIDSIEMVEFHKTIA